MNAEDIQKQKTSITVASEMPGLRTSQIIKTWWPLAFSWLLMLVEIPVLSAVMARLANPEVNLAAYGGVVYPLALIIESPIVMLLGASTALSRHRQSYKLVWRFMMMTCAVLTGLHILLVFTPIYYLIVRSIMGVPEEIVEPARLGLMIMLPWAWMIGYRRFQQGVMIRYGFSKAVGVGTVVRLVADAIFLLAGYMLQTIPGIAVATAAQVAGIVSEAIFAGWRVRPILKNDINPAPVEDLLTWKQFYAFYLPLVLTALISLVWQSIGSSMLARMPGALNTLAVWPVVTGLVSILRSFGIAYNEVVITLLDRKGAYPVLKRFAVRMAVIVTVLTLLISATPLSMIYFSQLMALPVDLVGLAVSALWVALPVGALAVFQNWFQGMIMFGKSTRGVPESVVIFFVTLLLILGIGVIWKPMPGLYIGMIAYLLANTTQMVWLWLRSRPVAQRFE